MTIGSDILEFCNHPVQTVEIGVMNIGIGVSNLLTNQHQQYLHLETPYN